MNKNVLLLLLLLVIGGVVYLMSRNRPDTSASFNRAESNFKIEDINTIGRILLTQKNGDRSDLRRVGDHWTINEVHRARQTNIEHLLKGIQRQHLDHIPNKAASENIVTSMAINGIHVEIFDRAGELLLDYYVGGVTQDERGTFFLKQGSSQPYCLIEPGFDGGLRVRYGLEPVHWRDVRYWQEQPERLDTLKVHYPKQREHSFVIFRNGSRFEVKPMFTTTPIKQGDSHNRVQSYFINLSQLACEDYINQAPERDSIVQMVPFMAMEVIYPDRTSSLRFFPAGPVGVSEFSPAIERYYIDYEGRDFMIGQHEVMKAAFRSYEYFFGQ